MSDTVLITGASSGIGLELSKQFAKDEFNLILVANNSDRLKEAANIIRQTNKNIVIKTITKNLSLKDTPIEIYNEVKNSKMKVDILVNNAGTQVYGPIHETEIKKQLDLIQVNLLALTHLTMLFLKDMVENGKGKILNVASTGGFAPVPLNAIYCATKAFVLNFSEAIGRDLEGTGVSVTCLCPGATKTDFADKAGIQNIRLFQSFVMDAKTVAQNGYHGLIKNKTIIIPGLYNKLSIMSIRFTPRMWITIVGKYFMSKK